MVNENENAYAKTKNYILNGWGSKILDFLFGWKLPAQKKFKPKNYCEISVLVQIDMLSKHSTNLVITIKNPAPSFNNHPKKMKNELNVIEWEWIFVVITVKSQFLSILRQTFVYTQKKKWEKVRWNNIIVVYGREINGVSAKNDNAIPFIISFPFFSLFLLLYVFFFKFISIVSMYIYIRYVTNIHSQM